MPCALGTSCQPPQDTPTASACHKCRKSGGRLHGNYFEDQLESDERDRLCATDLSSNVNTSASEAQAEPEARTSHCIATKWGDGLRAPCKKGVLHTENMFHGNVGVANPSELLWHVSHGSKLCNSWVYCMATNKSGSSTRSSFPTTSTDFHLNVGTNLALRPNCVKTNCP